MVTTTIWEGRLVGTFLGYKYDRAYDLSDGSRWRQINETDEPVYREHPTARLLYERSLGRTWLDVEGTSAIVEVAREGSRIKPRVGAF